MPNAKPASNPKSFNDTKGDRILIEAKGLAAWEDLVSDVSFEWLLEYSQSSLEELT